MSVLNVFHIAASAQTAQSMRLNVVASNLANVDSAVSADGTPYRARQVVFQAAPVAGERGALGVRVARVIDDPSPPRLVYQPGHPLADERGYVTMPNVDPVEELVNMISASRSYQFNTDMMNTAQTLALRTIGLLQS
jgi:flagellar basal-body rod protein FlgC